MNLTVVEHEELNVAKTQDFLSQQPGVADVQVWISGEKILAQVQIYEWSKVSDFDLRSACKRKIGAKLTPALILMERIQGEKSMRSA
ncbi:MAG: hypothetical protein KF824_12205 [Fimbriimonadaceae bacterium]|nr:MAG: hypothetical protein KF824_12205 [Fimbriimonadaceae bacterium]